MWEIWENQLSPKALKSCPKSNKSPNLVTLHTHNVLSQLGYYLIRKGTWLSQHHNLPRSILLSWQFWVGYI